MYVNYKHGNYSLSVLQYYCSVHTLLICGINELLHCIYDLA